MTFTTASLHREWSQSQPSRRGLASNMPSWAPTAELGALKVLEGSCQSLHCVQPLISQTTPRA